MDHATDRLLSLEIVEDVAVVGFTTPRLVADEEIRRVGEQLYFLVEQQGRTRLLLNFSGLEFMSSAMLGKVMGLHKKMTAAQGQLKLCCIVPQLREVFRISQFDRVLEIHDDELAALDSFRQGGSP